jgi:hypothetical protein
MSKRSLVMAATIVFTLALATLVLAADPFAGTWKLNLAKSKLPAGQAPKSQIVKNESMDNGLKNIVDTVDANGKTTHSVCIFKFDGKDYPVTGDPNMDMCAFRRIDANTADYVCKKVGKEVLSGRVVVSNDGKTTTETAKVKDAKGQEVTLIFVNDKQ